MHPQISIARQCDLVGLPRSTYYYQAQGESAEHLYLMRLLDKQDTDTPYYGVRRMTAWLRRQGYAVNHKRVARLLRTLGLRTIYPTPRPGSGARQRFCRTAVADSQIRGGLFEGL